MPKGMHLVLGLTSLDTSRKKKPKITKKRMKQLVEEHRLYNKKMKQTNNRKDMISFDEGSYSKFFRRIFLNLKSLLKSSMQL